MSVVIQIYLGSGQKEICTTRLLFPFLHMCQTRYSAEMFLLSTMVTSKTMQVIMLKTPRLANLYASSSVNFLL